MHTGQLMHSPTWCVPTLPSFILTYVVNLDGVYFYVTKGGIRGMGKCAVLRLFSCGTQKLSSA